MTPRKKQTGNMPGDTTTRTHTFIPWQPIVKTTHQSMLLRSESLVRVSPAIPPFISKKSSVRLVLINDGNSLDDGDPNGHEDDPGSISLLMMESEKDSGRVDGCSLVRYVTSSSETNLFHIDLVVDAQWWWGAGRSGREALHLFTVSKDRSAMAWEVDLQVETKRVEMHCVGMLNLVSFGNRYPRAIIAPPLSSQIAPLSHVVMTAPLCWVVCGNGACVAWNWRKLQNEGSESTVADGGGGGGGSNGRRVNNGWTKETAGIIQIPGVWSGCHFDDGSENGSTIIFCGDRGLHVVEVKMTDRGTVIVDESTVYPIVTVSTRIGKSVDCSDDNEGADAYEKATLGWKWIRLCNSPTYADRVLVGGVHGMGLVHLRRVLNTGVHATPPEGVRRNIIAVVDMMYDHGEMLDASWCQTEEIASHGSRVVAIDELGAITLWEVSLSSCVYQKSGPTMSKERHERRRWKTNGNRVGWRLLLEMTSHGRACGWIDDDVARTYLVAGEHVTLQQLQWKEKWEPKDNESGMRDEAEDGEYTPPSEIELLDTGFVYVRQREVWEENPQVMARRDCTYARGKVRQIVFVCETCRADGVLPPEGLCEQCAKICHRGHHVRNIGTKRSFQCDCGRGSTTQGHIQSAPCQLCDTVKPVRSENTYGHNFEDRWCYCDTEEILPMLQCLDCDDWFHARHPECIGITSEDEGDGDWMYDLFYLCENCLQAKYQFLISSNDNGGEGSTTYRWKILPSMMGIEAQVELCEGDVIGIKCRKGVLLRLDYTDFLNDQHKRRMITPQEAEGSENVHVLVPRRNHHATEGAVEEEEEEEEIDVVMETLEGTEEEVDLDDDEEEEEMDDESDEDELDGFIV